VRYLNSFYPKWQKIYVDGIRQVPAQIQLACVAGILFGGSLVLIFWRLL